MKILIINENRHNSIGGIEKYTRELIRIFKKQKHEVYEYAINLNPERIDMFKMAGGVIPLNLIPKSEKPLSILKKNKNVKKAVKDISKIWNEFDLIINQIATPIRWNKAIYKSDKWLYVQHFNPDFYRHKYIANIIFWPIIYFGIWLFQFKNPFKVFRNFVCYTNDDANELIKKRDVRYWPINLAAYSKQEIIMMSKEQKKARNGLIYFGRIDDYQKNISNLIKLAYKQKINLDLYGSGDLKIINSLDNQLVKYKGYLNNHQIKEIITKYRFSILLSKYEGFAFSIVESISCGLPVITTNCAKGIKWLVRNNGFIYNKQSNLKDLVNLNEEDYKKLVDNCFCFAIENLTIEQFEQKWLDLLTQWEKKLS